MTVHIDRERQLPVKMTRTVGKPGDEIHYVGEHHFTDYDETHAERPDDIPFSIREIIRWVFYRIGLI